MRCIMMTVLSDHWDDDDGDDGDDDEDNDDDDDDNYEDSRSLDGGEWG